MDAISVSSTIVLAILLLWMAFKPKNAPGLLKLSLSLIALASISPVLLIALALFALYQQIVTLKLKSQHGSRFLGLLSGFDSFTLLHKPTMVVNIFFVVNFAPRSRSATVHQTVGEEMQRVMFDHPENYPRFMATYHKSMGYHFRLRNDNVTLGDCLRKMERLESNAEEVEEDRYMDAIRDCANSPLPKDNTILWEAVVGTQPIKWSRATNANGAGKFYPILFRFHHGITDGVSLLKFVTCVIADLPKDGISVVAPSKAKGKVSWASRIKRVASLLHELVLVLYSLALLPITVLEQPSSKGQEENVQKGPALSGKQLFVMVPEESVGYVEKIKRIKNGVPGASFADVLLTAWSSCLCDYFERHTEFRPSYITTLIPVSPGSAQVRDLVPGDCVNQEVGVGNSFSMIMPKVPVFAVNSNASLMDRLKLVMEETDFTTNFVEYQTNIWIMHSICGFLPYFLIKKILRLQCTTFASFLVGPRRLSFAKGAAQLDSVCFWPQHGLDIGLGLSCVTYDGRLQLGLSADQALLPDNKAVRDIIKNMYKYLDLFEKEIECL